MKNEFKKLLLSELHVAVYNPGDKEKLSDDLLTEAITMNENLSAYGYVLKPNDVLKIAVSDDLYMFFSDFTELIPDVKAEPMYPDFPTEVMEMSEAQFRFHQFLHYFSTYGVEMLTGYSVNKGWLPKKASTHKKEADTTLIDAKVIDLVPVKDAYIYALKIILSKRERPTIPENELILEAVKHVTPEELETVSIPFKENLTYVFELLADFSDREIGIQTLSKLCLHSGDVLKCIHSYLRNKKYHLSTSKKRLFVNLLEKYSDKNFSENLMRSNREREKNLVILNHLDYNKYSKSVSHRNVVKALRNHELKSWEGMVEELLRNEDPSALDFIGKRPGMLLRKLNRLLDMGYSEEELTDAICVYANKLSLHTLVQTIKFFSRSEIQIENDYRKSLQGAYSKIAAEKNNKLKKCSTKYCDMAKPYTDSNVIDEINAKMRIVYNEQGIPKKSSERDTIADEIKKLENDLYLLKKLRSIRTYEAHGVSYYEDWEELKLWMMIESNEDFIGECEARYEDKKHQLSEIDMELEVLYRKCEEIYKELEERYLLSTKEERALQLNILKKKEDEERKAIEEEYNDETSQVYHEAIAEVERKHNSAMKSLVNAFSIKRILINAMSRHFSLSSTPLKEKKVFLDLDLFDLKHSELELNEKSADGGYIRSGISYKIPDDAKYVRFFTYWNDKKRVDIDLHAYGYTTNGSSLHIGWNSDFNNSGVVFSGDITHSNAAEYIDIDLSAPIRVIYADVDLFYGKDSFNHIEECFVGLMAVDKNNESVVQYNPNNCFFTHNMRQRARSIYYGYIDVQNRYVRFVGQNKMRSACFGDGNFDPECKFSVEEYLNILFNNQQVSIVDNKEEADVILTMGKSSEANAVSLVDNNFFLEY